MDFGLGWLGILITLGVILFLAYWPQISFFRKSDDRASAEKSKDIPGGDLGDAYSADNFTVGDHARLFLRVFHRVFSDNPWSWPFARAAILNTIALTIIVFVVLYLMDFHGSQGWMRGSSLNWSSVLTPFIILSVLNLFADYLSLVQTRYFVMFAARGGTVRAILLAIADFFTTALIFAIIVLPGYYLLFTVLEWGPKISEVAQSLANQTGRVEKFNPDHNLYFFWASFITTFLSTMWYLTFLFGGIFWRVMVGLGRDPNEKPSIHAHPAQWVATRGFSVVAVLLILGVLAILNAPPWLVEAYQEFRETYLAHCLQWLEEYLMQGAIPNRIDFEFSQ